VIFCVKIRQKKLLIIKRNYKTKIVESETRFIQRNNKKKTLVRVGKLKDYRFDREQKENLLTMAGNGDCGYITGSQTGINNVSFIS
jgi:stage III sporulation protein SpoIIIAA